MGGLGVKEDQPRPTPRAHSVALSALVDSEQRPAFYLHFANGVQTWLHILPDQAVILLGAPALKFCAAVGQTIGGTKSVA